MDNLLVFFIVIIILIGIVLKKLVTKSINPYRLSKVRNWAKQGKYFNFDGYPLFYYDSSVRDPTIANKATLLLLHGYPTSSIDWLTHDVGDTVAQELLARQTNRREYLIQSTMFLNGGLFPESYHTIFMVKLLKKPILGVIIQYLTTSSIFASSVNRLFGPMTKRNNQELDEITSLLFYNAPYNLLQQLQCYCDERIIYRERWVNALNQVQILEKNPIPIALINGPWDPISRKHMLERYRQVVKNPDTRILPENIGHFPNVEDPENTLRYFLDFHDRLSA